MKFMRDEFAPSLLLYILSLAWFGGVGHSIISSDEPIIFKIFYILGLLILAIRVFVSLHESD